MKMKKKSEQSEQKHQVPQGKLAMKEGLFQLDQMLIDQSAQVNNGGQGPHQEDISLYKYLTNHVKPILCKFVTQLVVTILMRWA